MGQFHLKVEARKNATDVAFHIPVNTPLPKWASQIFVFPKSTMGAKTRKPAAIRLIDAFAGVLDIFFNDLDFDEDELGGAIQSCTYAYALGKSVDAFLPIESKTL